MNGIRRIGSGGWTAVIVLLTAAATRGQVAQTQPATRPAPELKHTVVTAVLDHPIPPRTNVVWCGTFQLAWNELMDYAGGPIGLDEPPAMLPSLNRGEFAKDMIDEDSYVAVAGPATGAISRARAAMNRKFPNETTPLLDQLQGPWLDIVSYAFLYKRLEFEHEFEPTVSFFTLDDPNIGTDVLSFGIEDYAPAELSRQVHVLWHQYVYEEEFIVNQHFIVELRTSSPEDRLILAAVPPGKSLYGTVAAVLKRIEFPNHRVWDPNVDELDVLQAPSIWSSFATLLPTDVLKVPVIDVDLVKSFGGLLGRPVVAKNPDVDGLLFSFAKQTVHFRLHKGGVELKSEAGGGLFGGGFRRFEFDRPFLVMLMRKGAKLPYLAIWVGHDEILQKAPPEAQTGFGNEGNSASGESEFPAAEIDP